MRDDDPVRRGPLVVRCSTTWQQDGQPSLGEQVRKLRVAAGLTQQQLASRTGSTQPAVAHLEAGLRVPTLPTLEKLARALEQDLHLLVPGTPPVPA